MIAKMISEKVLKECDKKKLSINQLAKKSKLTQSTLQSIVSTDSKNPKLLTIMKICKGLRMELSEFFEDEIFRKGSE